ncbi:MAG: SCO family protein [Bacteroidetes bacterium]|nr:SCO family protein [Bacteroidota bacterium]MBS1747770.1 SCO family protein [Bacteroidota bacterium]
MLRHFICTLFFSWSLIVFGYGAPANLDEEQNIYAQIYNAPIKLSPTQAQVSLADIYNRKPMLLAFVFTRCTGVCSPFLLQLNETLRQISGKYLYQVVVLSFDPRDDVEAMQSLSTRLHLEKSTQWIFATTDSITALNLSLGFDPIWDSSTNQFDHEALLVGVNTQGYITKKLLGIRGDLELRQMLASINNAYIPSYRLPADNDLFSCFTYDPTTGKNIPNLGLLIIALPALVSFLLLVCIAFFSRNKAAKWTE